MEASNSKKQATAKALDIDTIMQEEVGQFGLFQKRNIILALIAVVFLAWSNNSYVFTAARIPTRATRLTTEECGEVVLLTILVAYFLKLIPGGRRRAGGVNWAVGVTFSTAWAATTTGGGVGDVGSVYICKISECDLEEPVFTPEWLLNAIPGTSLESFDNCQRFGNASAATIEEGVCPATWFDQDQRQSCERRHLYQNTDTIVYDFDLACDEWRRTMVGSIRLSGTLFAQVISGFVSDRWGRRTALVFNAFNAAWLGILRSFSNSYITFVIVEFVSSVLGSATFQSSYILLMELVIPKNRVFVGACLNTTSSVGLMSLALIAWKVPYWRNLTRALYIPQLMTITYIWAMNESVRWYISKGRYEDTEKALKNIARVNKKHISEKSLEVLRNKAEELKTHQDKASETEQGKNEPSLIKLLFQHKAVMYRCFITPFMWISFTFIHQGLTINAVDISGNKYVNYMAVSAAQIPGFWVALLLLDKVGRKPVLIGSYWICAACQIVFILMPKNQYILSLMVYMVGASASGGILISVYIYTAELYPTRYRHRLFAFSSMVGRLGAILAPLTPALGALVWDKFPFALFAGFACVSGALVLLTPETRGVRLPDTMQEAADLGKKKRQSIVL